jgi:sulfonate transport system substrate-binding protein
MRKRKVKVLALLLGGMMALSACGSDTNNAAGEEKTEDAAVSENTENAGSEDAVAVSGDLQSVRIATCAATGALSDNALLADNLGYIEEELAQVGFKPEYIGFAQAGPAVNEAFAAQEIDYAVYAEFPAITAKSNGVDLTIIGTVNQETNYALLATEASGIKSAADMAGKKIIVTPGTILYKHFVDLCDEYGINPDDVEQISALSDAQTLLATGDADGLIFSYGGAKLYESYGIANIVEDTRETPELASGMVLAGRTQFVEENPDVAKALLRALNRAANYAAEHPDEVPELLVTESTPLEVTEASYAYDQSYSYFSPALSDEYLARAQRVYDFCTENSLLGSEVDLNELFDSTYVDEVLGEN